MNDELEERAEELFHQALELPQNQLSAFLEQACAENSELRAAVERLLEAAGEASGFFAKLDQAIAASMPKPVGSSKPASAASDKEPSPSISGQILGDFELVREIGHGGMGVVWEAWQTSIGRTVALKILPPERLWKRNSIERFRREAEAAGRVHHPGITTIHTIGEANGLHFIAQEYVEGGRTLADRARRSPPAPRDA